MTIDVLILGGTGFPRGGDGVTTEFVRHLDHARFEAKFVEYPASFGGLGESWADSREAGRRALIEATIAGANPVVWAGYSQGAGIVGDLAAERGAGTWLALQVLGVALIADPSRPRGAGLPGEAPASGHGIVGERDIAGMPAWWAAAEHDPITALADGNRLELMVNAVEYFSLRSIPDAERWGHSLIDGALSIRWRPREWLDFRAWGAAAEAARNYLPYEVGGGGRHTAAYIELGLCARLAQAVNREVS